MAELTILHTAQQVARQQRDQVLVQLQEAQRQCAAATGQLEQLDSYAVETQNRWGLAAGQHTTPHTLQHFGQFMQRLQQAISLQQQALQRQQHNLRTHQQRLLQIETRIAALSLLLEKRLLAIQRQRSRQEQKQMDELAALQHRRHRKTPDSMGIS